MYACPHIQNAICLDCANNLFQENEARSKKNRELGIHIQQLQASLHQKNLELDSLHYVWCTGGCKTGIHRYSDLPPLTQEIVDTAERNVQRLKTSFLNQEFRKSRENP